MAIQYVTEEEMLRALGKGKKPPTLSVDNGAGQSCAYVKIGDKCLRLRMDAAFSPNLMTALGVITYYDDEHKAERNMPLVSNNMMAYDTLRRLHMMTDQEVDWALATGVFRSLLLDMLLAMAYEVSSVLYLPLPEGCSEATVQKMAEAAAEIFEKINTDDYPLVQGRFASVKTTRARFSPVYQDFKAPPTRWDRRFDNEHSHCELMALHFTALMRCMILHNVKIFYQLSFRDSRLPGKEELRAFVERSLLPENESEDTRAQPFRVIVGCPASEVWNKNEYSEMLRRALRAVKLSCIGNGTACFLSDQALLNRCIREIEASWRFRVMWEMESMHSFRGNGFFERISNERPEALKKLDLIMKRKWELRNDSRICDAVNYVADKPDIPGPEIILEPCAAILPHVTGSLHDKAPNVMRGVGVCDSGANTNDMTLVLYQQEKSYRINCSSPTFGGAQLDRNMLFILRRNVRRQRETQGLDTEFDLQEMPALQLALRLEKERYYESGRKDGQRSITFHLMNGEAHTQRYQIGELMHEALHLPYRAACESINAPERSFLERAEAFLDEAVRRFCIATGVGADFRFETLIVTGGASNVKELRDVMEKNRYFKQLLAEKDPSASVGSGLAMSMSEAETKRLKAVFKQEHKESGIQENAKNMLCSTLKNALYGEADDAAGRHIARRDSCSLETYISEVTQGMMSREEVKNCVKKYLADYACDSKQEIWKSAVNHMESHFPGCIEQVPKQSPEAVDFTRSFIKAVVESAFQKMDVRNMLRKISDGAGSVKHNLIGFGIDPVIAVDEIRQDMSWSESAARHRLLERKNFKAIRAELQKMKEVNDKRIVDAIDEAFEKSGINVRLRDEYIEKITAYLTMSHFDTDQTGGEV